MAKRGHKNNSKETPNQATSTQIQPGTDVPMNKPSNMENAVKGNGSEQITKYFPASPKTSSSQSSADKATKNPTDTTPLPNLENIPGLLTPETTPKKDYPKTKCILKGDNSTARTLVTETTDSPQHKKSVPCTVITESKSEETNAKDVAERGSGDKEQKGKKKGQKKEQSASNKGKRGKSKKSRAAKEPSGKTTTLKDFFPIRRSSRRCKSEIKAEQLKEIEEAILSVKEDGLKVTDIEDKGRGVVATKAFKQGDFVVEYYGDLIDTRQAKKREAEYTEDSSIGCYMYYFQFKTKQYCVDATRESGRLGRLLNHSTKLGNCCTKLVEVKGQPHLIIVAARDISEGEELLYDYGDRNKESLQAHPWLAL